MFLLFIAILKSNKGGLLIVDYGYFEKKMKNRKNKKATIPNLIESERKGGALSTIILLVINAEDQSITKIIGIIL